MPPTSDPGWKLLNSPELRCQKNQAATLVPQLPLLVLASQNHPKRIQKRARHRARARDHFLAWQIYSSQKWACLDVLIGFFQKVGGAASFLKKVIFRLQCSDGWRCVSQGARGTCGGGAVSGERQDGRQGPQADFHLPGQGDRER